MRVLTIGNLYPPHALGGGYEVTWRSAVEHQRAAGIDVRVLTTDHRSPDVGEPDPPDVHRELRWYWRDHALPHLTLRQRVALERHNGRVLERHLDEFNPDAVAWWAMGGMSLALIERVRRAGLPAVGVVGDGWMTYGPKVDAWQRFMGRPLTATLRRPLERISGIPSRVDLSRAGPWLFNSEAIRSRSLAAAGGLCDARVVHPGVDQRLFKARSDDRWAWRLLYVGRVEERKGVDVAVDALADLPPEARLSIVGAGDPTYVAQLHERAERIGAADRVEFREVQREEVPGELARADAVLFPVRWDEPWGLVPLEAMATGTPVVATATGGAREYLRDRDNCLTIESPPEGDAAARAVRELAGAPGLRAALRRAGVETAARYSEDAYNEAILQAVREAPTWRAC